MPVKLPIEVIIDAVPMTPLPSPGSFSSDGDVPIATHSGVLRIGDHELKVYQLASGKRVIDVADFNRLLEGTA